MENIMPSLECKTLRVGGSNYQVPLEVSPARRVDSGSALSDCLQPHPW
jgi:Ribosomal protein S7